MTVLYLDASALVKLIFGEEQHARELREFVAGADLVGSELGLTEVPRAIRRKVADDDALVKAQLRRAIELLDSVGMQPLEGRLLEVAGALGAPSLRSLDAIHIATALYLQPIDAFVTYDVRQAESARLAGFRTVSPGR